MMRWNDYENEQINKAVKTVIATGRSCFAVAREVSDTLHYRTHDSIRRKLQTLVNREMDQNRGLTVIEESFTAQ